MWFERYEHSKIPIPIEGEGILQYHMIVSLCQRDKTDLVLSDRNNLI